MRFLAIFWLPDSKFTKDLHRYCKRMFGELGGWAWVWGDLVKCGWVSPCNTSLNAVGLIFALKLRHFERRIELIE